MLENTLKIILIMILAGIIGWDREQHGRPAGFRTHILVGIGSTIIMIVSVMIYKTFPGADADPGRIAAQVVSGIGFLGAGTIMVRGSIVRGLTTAASLWTTAAIGLAVGAGLYYIAVIGTVITFISLFFLSHIEISKKKNTKQELLCRFDNWDRDYYKMICEKLEEKSCVIRAVKMTKDTDSGGVYLKFLIDCEHDLAEAMNSWLPGLEGIIEFSWSEFVI
ncbi:MAG: MgtC/SapB family protein [Halanaerobiaceae bacterium]|nr:MgtC/SapB family protein [Halanaerobiaceae bacterium]